MGKEWDRGVPSADVWREVLRVLKPGGPLMAFGGTRTFHRLACAIEDAGFLLSDTLCWLYGQGFPKGQSQLKPAWEPITLAWKKGKRGLNIDAGRVAGGQLKWAEPRNMGYHGGSDAGSVAAVTSPLGRWPANVLLDEESARLLDEESAPQMHGAGAATDGKHCPSTTGGIFGQYNAPSNRRDDSGGASRFFYISKADRSEREAGLEGFPLRSVAETDGRNPALNSAMRMENGVPTGPKANSSAARNFHPTVKPVDLCAYLAKLLLPQKRDGPRKILAPFSGSGSEIMGALRAGWDEAVGIEVSAEYAELARRRISGDSPLFNWELPA